MSSRAVVNCDTSKHHDLLLLANNEFQVVDNPQPSIVDEKGTKVANGRVASLEYLARALNSSKNMQLMGTGEEDFAHIHQWVTYALTSIESGESDVKTFGKLLNDHLKTKTFLVGNSLSLADLVMYTHTHPHISQMTSKRRFDLCNLVRWFDLVQNFPLTSSYSALGKVSIELEESIPQSTVVQDANMDDITMQHPVPKDTKKKEKKEKKPAVPASAVAELAVNNPARLDIRVGKIVDVKRHENADSLYVEQIDLGEETGPRTIVSGLVKHVPIEEMQNRLVLVLCNLKPASMRGVKSDGMVLAATSSEGKVELLEPVKGSLPGERAYFEGFSHDADVKPDAQLNPKKKIWETIQPGLFTDDERVACYKVIQVEGGVEETGKICRLMTSKGPCVVPTVIGASIK